MIKREASHVIVVGGDIYRGKSFPWNGETLHGKPSTDEEGSAVQTQQ